MNASQEVVADRYELRRLVGSGAMGEVWLAEDRRHQSPVAIKLLIGSDQTKSSRFLREGVLLSRFRHPAIVRYVDHGCLPSGQPYLAMEWLDGEDLSSRLARRPLTISETVVGLRRVVEALAAAHAEGIVHRDIKPSNLFLPKGSVTELKVLDFGVSRIKDWTRTWTKNGVMLGTPAYMAPEQIRASPDIDGRADLFSAGCVAFECLTGRPPFRGEEVTVLLRSVLGQQPPSLTEQVRGVPAPLSDLVFSMMAKDPAHRPQSAGEVLAVLDGLGPQSAVPIEVTLSALTRDERRFAAKLVIVGESLSEETLAAAARTSGARLERLDGLGFLMTWSGAVAATDRAAQAALCALELAEAHPHSRTALVTECTLDDGSQTGHVTRIAQSLLGESGFDGIALDDTTSGLLSGRFDLRQRGGRAELVGARQTLDPPRLPWPVPEAFSGRDREMAVLVGVYDQCVEESVSRMVLVIGGTGSGKSRCCRELAACLSAPDRGAGKVPWIIAVPPFDQAVALSDTIATRCQVGPVLLLVDDFHQADARLIQVLHDLWRTLREAPLMIVAFARPELNDLLPDLWAEGEVREVRLGAMGRRTSECLVRDLAGDDISPDAVAGMVTMAGGTPLFLVELARARGPVPATVLAIAQDRVARLESETRRVLRAASVFGSTFWRGGVVALVGNTGLVDRALAELVAQGMILRRSTCRFRDEEELEFCEPLDREAAYATLTDADHALGHRLAGEWLGQMGERDEVPVASLQVKTVIAEPSD